MIGRTPTHLIPWVLVGMMVCVFLIQSNARLKDAVLHARDRYRTSGGSRGASDVNNGDPLQRLEDQLQVNTRELRVVRDDLRTLAHEIHTLTDRPNGNKVTTMTTASQLPPPGPLGSGTFRPQAGGGYDVDAPWEQLASRPRLFLIRGLLTPQQCDEIRHIATPFMQSTRVVGKQGGDEVSSVRTNTGMFLNGEGQSSAPPVLSMRGKISQFVMQPMENIEPINVLRYASGQFYKPHFDWFPPIYKKILSQGGQRVASVLIWLNDVPSGGETEFPSIHQKVKGKKGDAVAWWNVNEQGETEQMALHTGVPPGDNSTKWVAVAWIRASKFV